ncbi:complement factor H like 2 isoform X1 [Silurus asotus]|uniref:Complement factor H like 2 isoform X1 n=1 Tax=Silurus asotus TaxID=30991 RepID=A0AAD5A9I7_SILAS|nr:complement factor H like 2 isoform X1 [Silurus asotus]
MWIIILALSILSCQVKSDLDCDAPTLERGFFIPVKESYKNRDVVYYSCNKDLKPARTTGWGRITCTDNKWTPAPLCIPKTSCLPPLVPNGSPVHKRDFYPHGYVQFQCDPNYEFENEQQWSSCDNGSWKDLPVCRRLPNHCGPPPRVENGLINGPYKDDYREQERVQYVCAERYELIGENQIQCTKDPKDDADFDPVSECETPYIKDGDFIPLPGEKKLQVQCKTFYKLFGPKTVRCVNKKWTELPVCKREY